MKVLRQLFPDKMKTFLYQLLFFCVSLVALVSCASKKPVAPVILTKTQVIKETVKDTIWEVKADSAYYQAYIDCVNGMPVIKNPIKAQAGSYIKAPKVKLEDHQLKVDCTAEAQKLFKSWRESYIYEKEPVPVEIPKIEYRDKPYSWFVKIQLWAGRFFIISCIGMLFYLLIKTKWKIF